MSTFDGSGIDTVLAAAVEDRAVPHVAAIAADRDGVFYEGAAGDRVVGCGEPVSTSTHFRIMSMTKMVATTAALQQVEQGLLDLDAPVEEYLSEFSGVQVLDGWDGDTPKLREPASRATVRHLVTHTSGLGYFFWNADLVKYEQVTGLPNVVPGDISAFRAPMVADPGTRFEYGINTDWLGRVVEAVAGTTLDVVVK
ncbi:MAG: methyl acetate hydrolase, partial [Actinomycetota bacterium]|nr:methyl acetate hydrolase [Actinomycetota bacterium]